MKEKILKYTIFAVAIVDCLLALVFSMRFNDEKKDGYAQVQTVKSHNPQMLSDIQTATPESLPGLVSKYQATFATYGDSLKKVQMQKDILYTYLQELKGLDENTFAEYKAGFNDHSALLFAKSDNKEAYINGFNAVNSFADLESYTSKLESEYDVLKQNYLLDRDYLKAANSLVSKADLINSTASANKKSADLQELQNDIKSFGTNASFQTAFIYIAYVLLAITVLLMVAFAVAKIVVNFRTSYKILVVLALAAVIVYIGYLIGSPELSPSAIKMGMSVTGYKMVNAGCFIVYIGLLCAVLAIVATSIMNAIKNRR